MLQGWWFGQAAGVLLGFVFVGHCLRVNFAYKEDHQLLTSHWCMQMSVRVLRTTESMNVVVLYLMMCTFVYSIIGCAFTWTSLVLPATTAEVALLLMQGLFGYGNQICITNGLSKAKAASVMCMQYFSIVFSQLAGMWFFGEFISFWGNVGMVVIVASMCIYMWVEARSKK